MNFPKLFSPITIRSLTLPNRVVMSAMGTKMVGDDRKMTQQIVDFLAARAEGGVGLLFSQVSSVHAPTSPKGFLAISTEETAESHRMLTEAIHAVGAKVGCQLWQGSITCASAGAPVLMPSELSRGPGRTIPGMTREQIAEVIDAYGKAAARAVRVGYDCLEFHSGHSYLPHAFLNPALNRRDDEYGGSLENRCRFGLECIRAIRANMPEDMPLFMRVVAHDDALPVNLSIEDIITYCKLAGEVGVDVIDVSRGNVMGPGLKYEVPPIDLPQGFNVDNAARIRRETGLLTIAVGRINTPQLAERILEAEQADMVVMARAQIADAEFCNKAREGRLDEISYCIGCDQGCMDPQTDPECTHITCMRNPAVGLEREYDFRPAAAPKTVLVAGGGMGGLEAAYTLRRRGHHVILCEASGQLGGQFLLAGVAPRKAEMRQAAVDNGRRAARVGVDIRLNTPVTPELIRQLSPDAVVLAIGAEPLILPLQGIDRPNVSNSHQVLAGEAAPQGDVGVIGGGLVGLEVAELLAEQGHRVSVIEMRGEVAADMGSTRRICVMEALAAAGIETVVNATCKAITDGGILAEQEGKEILIPCDSAVMAVGARSRSSQDLQDACTEQGIPFYLIGDAVKARRALVAVAEGAKVGHQLN